MDYDPVTLKWLRLITYVTAAIVSGLLIWIYGPGVSAAWAEFTAVRAEAAAAQEITQEMSRALIQSRRGLGEAGGELGFLLFVVLATAASLIFFAFGGKRHERSMIHERLAPHLQQYLDHSLGAGADDEKQIPPLNALEEDELASMFQVLDVFDRENHTVGSATKTFRELSLLQTYRRCYRLGFIKEHGDLYLTRLGRKAHKLFRLELLLRRQQTPWIAVPLADFQGKEALRIPETDIWVVNWEGGVSAVFGMDPTTGESIFWRRHRLRGKRSGNIFNAQGEVRIGPSEVGLTTFPVEMHEDEIRVDVLNPSEGELSDHRSGIGSRVWTGSSRHAENE